MKHLLKAKRRVIYLKSKIKIIFTVAILSTVMTGTAVASGLSQKINVVMNSINIKVDGKAVEEDNILYKGTTYVSLKAVGEILGMEVSWDQETKTMGIGNRDNPMPYLPHLIGSGVKDQLLIKTGGSFENPIGIPSTAVLTKAVAEEKWHKYSYRVNLPGGAYIEEIAFSGNYSTPSASLYGRDNDNESFLMNLYPDGRISYPFFGAFKMPALTDEDNKVIRHEVKRFLNAYGY